MHTADRLDDAAFLPAIVHPAVRGSLLALINGGGDTPRHMPTMTAIDDDALMDDALLGDTDGAGVDV